MKHSFGLIIPSRAVGPIMALILLCSCSGPTMPTAPAAPRISFPATLGTQWTYSYKYHYYYVMTFEGEDWAGSRLWQVMSVSSNPKATTCVIQCTSQDTVHLWSRFPHPLYGTVRDSTYVSKSISTFPVVVSSDTIVASWHRTVLAVYYDSTALTQFSRIVASTADTLRLQTEDRSAWYLSGIGLVRYTAVIVAHHYRTEELTLASALIK